MAKVKLLLADKNEIFCEGLAKLMEREPVAADDLERLIRELFLNAKANNKESGDARELGADCG